MPDISEDHNQRLSISEIMQPGTGYGRSGTGRMTWLAAGAGAGCRDRPGNERLIPEDTDLILQPTGTWLYFMAGGCPWRCGRGGRA